MNSEEKKANKFFVLPFHGKYGISQPFGANRDVYSRFGLNGHNGIDFRIPDGVPLYGMRSDEEGIVIKIGDQGEKGWGIYMDIEYSGFGIIRLAHLKEVCVPLRSRVSTNTLCAYTDNTGFSTGPHLHLGMYPEWITKHNGFGGAVNPAPYLYNLDDNVCDEDALVSFAVGDVVEIKENVRLRNIPSAENNKPILLLYPGFAVKVDDLTFDKDGNVWLHGTLPVSGWFAGIHNKITYVKKVV